MQMLEQVRCRIAPGGDGYDDRFIGTPAPVECGRKSAIKLTASTLANPSALDSDTLKPGVPRQMEG